MNLMFSEFLFIKIYLETLRFLFVHIRGGRKSRGDEGLASSQKDKYRTSKEYLSGENSWRRTFGDASILCLLNL